MTRGLAHLRLEQLGQGIGVRMLVSDRRSVVCVHGRGAVLLTRVAVAGIGLPAREASAKGNTGPRDLAIHSHDGVDHSVW